MFILASATLVSAQSNFNCSVYPRLSVPGDMVSLINIWGNDSHAQFGNMSDYDYSVACKSNITTINTGCSGNDITVAQLYSGNDSHVSVDSFYPYNVCFNTSDTSLAWYYQISASGATPSDYECVFSIAKYNDSHVWDCDHADADYNINIKINSTLPPYSGCVDLYNASTFQDKVINNTDGFWFMKNASLCRRTYSIADSGSAGMIIMNASYLSLDCNSSTLIGNGGGYGVYSMDKLNVSLSNCNISTYMFGAFFNNSNNTIASNINVTNNSQSGLAFLNLTGATASAITARNNTARGVLIQFGRFVDLSGADVFNNSNGVGILVASNSSLSNVRSGNNSNAGIAIDQAQNISVAGLFSVSERNDGLTIDDSQNITLFNITVMNASNGVGVQTSGSVRLERFNISYYSNDGIYLTTTDDSLIMDGLAGPPATGALLRGIDLSTGSDRNNITRVNISGNDRGVDLTAPGANSTFSYCNFSGNDYGVYLGAGVSGNKFYYNRFYASVNAHAYAGSAGNYFNTTNGSSCGANCSRGNYWDDILSLDIVDSSGDGYGDSGTQYPYSSVNGGNVSSNVVDYGPWTTKGCVDADSDGFYAIGSSPGCPGAYRDCDDNNSSILPPYNGLSIDKNTWLCGGTYYVDDDADAGNDGVVNFNAESIILTCLGTTIIGNTTGEFVYDRFNYTVISGCNVSNYSAGIEIDGNRTLLYNLTTWKNALVGIELSGQSNNVTNWTAYNDSRCLRISGVSGSAFHNVTGSRGSCLLWGLVLSGEGSDNSFFMNLSFTSYGGNAVSLSDSENNTFRNNTFVGASTNWETIALTGGSVGNRFFYNSISGNGLYANSSKSENHFNTSVWNGTAFVARGNLWGDILSLDIYDDDSDGFGNAGTQYPYNSTNGANVNINVTDWGPITTRGPPAPPAAASIIIVGPNGTEITGTRSVLLNLTFGTGIACRWANDNESNLTVMLWEPCTTVKPWILSEPEGNKSVFMEVMAAGGATSIFNDSILYRFMQDYTPPTSPVVYDSDYGYDIDWWNSNTTLSAYWWNATDDISTIYYMYRILDEGACYSGDCNWTDAGAATDTAVSNLSLVEGRNYSFQVIAYTASGLNSSIATSNGTRIDLTSPSAPRINSTTHPRQDISYDRTTVRFNFTATDSASGIDGYSYVLDSHPGTAPDDNVEGRYWESLQGMVNDGSSQLLRAQSGVGSPNTYAVFSQLKQNFSVGDTIKVRVALAELSNDTLDEMGVKVYLISGLNGFVPVFNSEASAMSSIANVSSDIRYAESMSLAAVYEYDIVSTANVNDNTDDVYVVVTGITGDTDNRNNLSMAYSATSIDNTTKSYVCPDAGGCTENTDVLDYAIEVKREDSGSVWDVQYDNVRDGTYYFHVKAKDIAGNWGDTGHYTVMIDTAGVAVDIIAPFSGQVFTEENVTVTVKVSENANVTVIAKHPDGSNFTTAPSIFTSTHDFNVTLENGTNEIYAYAINLVNGVVSYSQSVFVLFGEYLPSGSRVLRVRYPAAGALSGHVRGISAGGTTVGIAVENDSAAFGADDIYSDTGIFTMKIFATKPGGLASAVEDDLDDDDFLDRINPMFGYKRGVSDYVVRNELRPLNIYLGGDRRVNEGKYTLVFRNIGTTPEGKANISVRII